LFSDGNETEGDARKAIPLLKDKNIALYTIPIGPLEIKDIKITYLDMPKIVREGQPIELKCLVSSTDNTMADIRIYRDKALVKDLKGVKLLQTQDNVIAVNLAPQAKPIQLYEVRVSTDEFTEVTLENNYGRAIIQKIGKPKILYISDMENPVQRTIPRIMKANHEFEFDTLPFVDMKKQDNEMFIKLYDGIVFDDVSLMKDYQDTPELLKSFVANGGGFLAVGGVNSFGLGGYHNSKMEDILPVLAVPPEDLAVVIVVDASGSMDEISGIPGKNKFRVASDALADSISLLAKTDRLEIITFNQGFETIIPLQPLAQGVPLLKEQLGKIKPTGPTAIIPPLQEAIKTLAGISSAKKHIMLLSDGHSTTNEPLDGFKQVADKLQQNNIAISAIATGDKINEETLKLLTMNGVLGKIYHLSNKEPDELTNNLRIDLAVSKEFYRELDNLPVQALLKSDILKGIDNIPPISGYDRTTLKPSARLVASVSKDNEVLIADWYYGLGKVMVMATSFDSKWMGQWERWGNLSQLVIQGLRYIMPLSSQENTPTKIRTEQLADETIKLIIEMPADGLDLFAQIEPLMAGNSANAAPVKIPQVAVGRYEVVLDNKGDSIISVFSESNNIRQFINRVPVVIQYPKEWLKFTPDTVFLRNLAESAGGTFVTVDSFRNDQIGNISQDMPTTYRRINAILIILALVLFIGDLVVNLYRG
jgi:Ca-activated chloride channel homolog